MIEKVRHICLLTAFAAVATTGCARKMQFYDQTIKQDCLSYTERTFYKGKGDKAKTVSTEHVNQHYDKKCGQDMVEKQTISSSSEVEIARITSASNILIEAFIAATPETKATIGKTMLTRLAAEDTLVRRAQTQANAAAGIADSTLRRIVAADSVQQRAVKCAPKDSTNNPSTAGKIVLRCS